MFRHHYGNDKDEIQRRLAGACRTQDCNVWRRAYTTGLERLQQNRWQKKSQNITRRHVFLLSSHLCLFGVFATI